MPANNCRAISHEQLAACPSARNAAYDFFFTYSTRLWSTIS